MGPADGENGLPEESETPEIVGRKFGWQGLALIFLALCFFGGSLTILLNAAGLPADPTRVILTSAALAATSIGLLVMAVSRRQYVAQDGRVFSWSAWQRETGKVK